MNELNVAKCIRNNFHWKLLTTVSALALIGDAYTISDARADSTTDRPTIWIDLGGQLERQTGQGDVIAQPFVVDNANSAAFTPVSPLRTERAPLYGNGAQGKITVEPAGSEWVFTVSALYGRSNGTKQFQQGAQPRTVQKIVGIYSSGVVHRKTSDITLRNADASMIDATQSQTHAAIDFQVGRDVGIGLFGKDSESVLGVGIRYADFTSRSTFSNHAIPDLKTFNFFGSYLANKGYYFPAQAFHSFAAAGRSSRSFHGVGPSVSWSGSVPIAGGREATAIDIDWGLNAAILFGRQKAVGAHQTSGHHSGSSTPASGATPPYVHSGSFDRERSVTIPNVGAFAGVSLAFPNAKVSFGYRGDFYFGAMDTGNDTRTTKTVGFYGPFATISVGLGG